MPILNYMRPTVVHLNESTKYTLILAAIVSWFAKILFVIPHSCYYYILTAVATYVLGSPFSYLDLSYVASYMFEIIMYMNLIIIVCYCCLHFALCFCLPIILLIIQWHTQMHPACKKIWSNVSYFDYCWLCWDNATVCKEQLLWQYCCSQLSKDTMECIVTSMHTYSKW